MNLRFSRFALMLSAALLGSSIPHGRTRADVPAPVDPGFDILLKVQPIVVLAKVGEMVGTSKKAFEPIPGDFARAPAYSEEYRRYRLHSVKLLKGKLPGAFDVRVISGSRNQALLDQAKGREMLLVLAPDSGLDPQGRPRDTFLITHGAAYLVRDGRFEVRGEQGMEKWSVERATDAIDRSKRERERQRAEAPEPPAAAAAVVAGEDKPERRERDPLEGPRLRTGKVLPPDALAKAAPKAIEGAGGDQKAYRPPHTQTPPTPEADKMTFRSEVQLGRTLEFRPRRVPRGDVSSHACLQGSYTHRYETTGITGREVWLCCIPVEEILKDSFHCAGGTLPRPFGSPDDIKIRYCSLLHPTASETTYIPVCIPAPLQAPDLDGPR